jgi:membrane-associated protease RseP (regulator of RpoE activity)
MITRVMEGRVAEQAGLHAGERIVAVDGRAVGSPRDVTEIVARRGGRPTRIELRDTRPFGPAATRTIVLTPEERAGRGLIGVQLENAPEERGLGVGEALPLAITTPASLTWHAVVNVTGSIAGRRAQVLAGPIGLVHLPSPSLGERASMLLVLSVAPLGTIAALAHLAPFPPFALGEILRAIAARRRRR